MEKVKEYIFTLLSRQTIALVSNTSLTGKVIVITGGSKGMGKATAEVLYKQGASIVVIARSMSDLKKAYVGYAKERVLLLQGDVTKENDCIKAIEKTKQQFGKIDVLINNAGIFSGKELAHTSLDEWRKSVAVNVEGIFLMSKAVIPFMKRQKNGLIINVGSKISRNTNITSKKVLYATTKYAVEGLTKALYRELKPFGIRVTCLMPGTVNTSRSLHAGEYLSPYRLAQLVGVMTEMEEVAFEDIVFTSKYQNI
jgi:NAD(P)-dependent dehydrogenase (short-subunit alcohol dehydrogenase family)